MWQKLESLISTILMLVMVAVGSLQILVRYIPSEMFDFFWTEELSRLLLVWFTFWGALVLQRTNDHISLPVFVEMLPEAFQLPIQLLVDAIVVIALAFLAWYGWIAAQLTIAQQTVGLGVSLAVFAYPVPIAAIVMIGSTLYGMLRRLKGRPIESAVTGL